MKDEKSAFPVIDSRVCSDGSEMMGCSDAGMTLRDWFAGQALSGYSVYFPGGGAIVPETAAEWCYKIADAMLAAREVK